MSFPNFNACERLAAAQKVLMDYPELPRVTNVDVAQGADGQWSDVTFLFFGGSESERIAAVDLLADRLGMTEVVKLTPDDDGTWTYWRRTPYRRNDGDWNAKAFRLTTTSTEAETPENTLAGVTS